MTAAHQDAYLDVLWDLLKEYALIQIKHPYEGMAIIGRLKCFQNQKIYGGFQIIWSGELKTEF